ncbi:MAG: signal recognition particle-docking protein FtsY [Oscillospiraceae bacterium]|nr:signal recognition particle-docking protein FtsY [Oscillospiraceae bacterium]
MSFFEKISNGLKKTRSGFRNHLDGLLGSFTKIDDELFEELCDILILSDVGGRTAEALCDQLRDRVKRERITDPVQIRAMLCEEITRIMEGDCQLHLTTKPSVVLVIGVNGVGKTTTIGKLAALERAKGKKVVIAAADTFRAAAAEQLGVWAERSGAELVRHQEGADPAAVVFDGITAAKARGADIVFVDTAGRLHNKKNLMDELSKIRRTILRAGGECDVETLLVLDATTGQNAVMQAEAFKETAGLTGIVLTKLDGTAKGGVVIGIRNTLGIPVKYIGVGEGVDDLQPFDPAAFAEALFAE